MACIVGHNRVGYFNKHLVNCKALSKHLSRVFALQFKKKKFTLSKS